MITIHICKAKGRYSKSIPIKDIKIRWISEETGKEIKPPKIYSCEHPKHYLWSGRKKRFSLEEMYVQKWELTEEEFKEATERADYVTLEMIGHIRIICSNCAKKILELKNKD